MSASRNGTPMRKPLRPASTSCALFRKTRLTAQQAVLLPFHKTLATSVEALPLAAPSVAAVAIFLFVMHWNDLLYPLLMTTDPAKATLPKALLDFKGEFTTNYPVLFAGVLVASAPMIVAYVFLQRYFVAGITAGATKG